MFLGLSLTHPRWRMVCFALSMLCVQGMVASFARGAGLSLAAVVAWSWFRAPNKQRTSLAPAGGLVAVVAGALLLSGEKRGGNDDSPTGSLRK